MRSQNEIFFDIDDSALWDLFRGGNQVAYTQLIKKFSKPLFNYGYRFCQDREFLMDCIQEVFFELWNRRERISPAQSVKWYLFKALRLRIFRDESKWNVHAEIGNDYEFLVEFNIESRMIDDQDLMELSAKVKNILNSLPPRQQEIMYLRFYESLNFDQIATIMEINKQSVHNLLQKAYKNFRTEWAFLLVLIIKDIFYCC